MPEVNLVSISKPTSYTGCETANELVAWAARVSNPSNQNNTKTAPKLIKYLVKNEHWSPLELIHVAIEIRTTRDIARQILRHRSFAFQEFSTRYSDPTKFLGFQLREARLQDQKNRQNSIEVEDTLLKKGWNSIQQKVIEAAKEAYTWAIDNGIAKEQARSVLPEGNTESVMIMAGSLRSWVHYCILRMGNGTQKEHMLVAEQCWNLISQEFPDVKAAVDEILQERELKNKYSEIIHKLFSEATEDDNWDDVSGDLFDELHNLWSEHNKL